MQNSVYEYEIDNDDFVVLSDEEVLSNKIEYDCNNDKFNEFDEEYIFQNNGGVMYYNYSIFWKTIDFLWDNMSYDINDTKSKIREYIQILANDGLLKLSASIKYVSISFRPNINTDFKEISYVCDELSNNDNNEIVLYNHYMILKGPFQTTWPITLQMYDNVYIQFPITFDNIYVD